MEVTINLEEIRRTIQATEATLAKLRAVEEYAASSARNGVAAKPTRSGKVPADQSAQRGIQAGVAEKVLLELGRPAKAGEMLDLALTRGWLKIKSTKRVLENGFYNAMRRRPDLFVVDQGTWDLVARAQK